MLIDRCYKIWNAASSKADGRPGLHYVQVVRQGHWDWLTMDFINNFVDPRYENGNLYNGAIIAIEGYFAAMVPVILTKKDWPGLVHRTHIQKAFAATKGKDMMPSLQLFPGLVKLDDGSSWERVVDGRSIGDLVFPDISTLVNVERAHYPLNSGRVTFAPEYLKRLVLSIASDGTKMRDVRFVHTSRGDDVPVLVEPATKQAHDQVGLPFGLLMPMISTVQDNYKKFVARYEERVAAEKIAAEEKK